MVGVDCHIGSQLTETAPFVDALASPGRAWSARSTPTAARSRYLDVGGGLGITYGDETPPTPAEYARRARRARRAPARPIHADLRAGPVLVGNAGVLLTRVLYRKQTASSDF